MRKKLISTVRVAGKRRHINVPWERRMSDDKGRTAEGRRSWLGSVQKNVA